MTTSEFKIGDIVRLPSGGPFMTVTGLPSGVGPKNVVGVAWFGEGDVLHWESFPPGALVHDERPIGAPLPVAARSGK